MSYVARKSTGDYRVGANAVNMIVRLRPRQYAYRHSATLSAIFLFALLPGSSLANAGSPEGYWYGKGYQPYLRKTMQWLTNNRSDGSYSVEFREYTNCLLPSAQVEEGRWTLSGDMLTKKVFIINGRSVPDAPDLTNTYRILEIDGLKMRILHEPTGQDWTSERVTKDFIFPDCANVS
jgi:hypothetical protein